MNLPCVVALAALLAQPAPSSEVHGYVADPTGLPVVGAEISSGDRSTLTDADGAFTIVVETPDAIVRVRAPGFAEYVARVRVPGALRIVMQPAGVAEVVTVTASRSDQRLADTSTATSSLPASVMLTSASLAADDLLRTVPGFSLFRRTSSRVANPTTQGASLRGLAASGASRALVLADGVPLNDPFGGWVYWNRVPQAALERIEVVRGGAGADLYGHESLGGTVQLITFRPARTSARLLAEGGQHGTARASVYGGLSSARWLGFAAAERLLVDGFPIVAAEERGPVDVNAGVRHTSALISGGRVGERRSIEVRGNWLDEDRDNGTPLQANDTRLWSAAARVTGTHVRGGWSAAAHAGSTRYRQSFSAVNATRTAETLTARQRIESDHQGASGQWTGAWDDRTLLVGGDFRRSSGESLDVQRGGTQTDTAAYTRITLLPGANVTVTAGARAGVWSAAGRESASSNERRAYMMPRVSLTWSPASRAAFSASWSAPGRTPTLNELYRDFRVGNTVTLANDSLLPERARTFEAGVLLGLGTGSARFVGFWTNLNDAVANVTLESGTLILRERRNAGAIRARGVEAEAEWRAGSWASVVASAAVFNSVFTRSDEPGLAGRRVPQVPRWQTAASLRLTPGRAVVTVDWRAIGPQFDDDRNQFRLRRAFVTDAFAGARLQRWQPFVAIENVFDAEVDVGRTPVRTVGTPRTARAGVRVFY